MKGDTMDWLSFVFIHTSHVTLSTNIHWRPSPQQPCDHSPLKHVHGYLDQISVTTLLQFRVNIGSGYRVSQDTRDACSTITGGMRARHRVTQRGIYLLTNSDVLGDMCTPVPVKHDSVNSPIQTCRPPAVYSSYSVCLASLTLRLWPCTFKHFILKLSYLPRAAVCLLCH